MTPAPFIYDAFIRSDGCYVVRHEYGRHSFTAVAETLKWAVDLAKVQRDAFLAELLGDVEAHDVAAERLLRELTGGN